LVWSLCYLVFRCVLQVVLLRPRSEDFKELEIAVRRALGTASTDTLTAADGDRYPAGWSARQAHAKYRRRFNTDPLTPVES
jgi:hypothetical protein